MQKSIGQDIKKEKKKKQARNKDSGRMKNAAMGKNRKIGEKRRNSWDEQERKNKITLNLSRQIQIFLTEFICIDLPIDLAIYGSAPCTPIDCARK